jgi:excisionase family DNA binding protein
MKAEIELDAEALIQGIVAGLSDALRSLATSSRGTLEHDPLIDANALAKHLCVTKHWIYQRVHSNTIPFFKVGKYTRFRVTDVEDWLADKARGPRTGQHCVRRMLERG